MAIKRFDHYSSSGISEMEESTCGEYVKYSDYEIIEQERDQLRQRIEAADKQKPVLWRGKTPFGMYELFKSLPPGPDDKGEWQPLYALPPTADKKGE